MELSESADRIREHDITLRSGRITLRPMTEGDWNELYRWDNDLEVSFYDGDHDPYDMETIHSIYRDVSRNAFNFIIEIEGRPIGWCWLQRMNLERVLKHFPGKDLRRIDIGIGEKEFWGQGIGTEIIHILTGFGFEHEHADAIFGCNILDYNERSRRAFERNGYAFFQQTPEEPGHHAKFIYDLMITREEYERSKVSG